MAQLFEVRPEIESIQKQKAGLESHRTGIDQLCLASPRAKARDPWQSWAISNGMCRIMNRLLCCTESQLVQHALVESRDSATIIIVGVPAKVIRKLNRSMDET